MIDMRYKTAIRTIFWLSIAIASVMTSGCGAVHKFRMMTIETFASQSELARMAMDDEDRRIRLAAVRKLSDQALLEKVALEARAVDAREVAARKLSSETVLFKVAMEDKSKYVSMTAVDNLTDQPLLAKVVMEQKESNIRDAALERLTDQELLAKVAMEHKSLYVRKAAVEKLTDQAMLAKVATKNEEWEVRAAAVYRLTSQVILTKVAVEDENWKVRVAAIGKLTSQITLTRIAMTDDEKRSVRAAAVKNLTDQAMLAKVALEAEAWDIRKLAFGRLSATGLAKLALEAKDRAVQLAIQVKRGELTWEEVFSATQIQASGLGNALGAVALVGYQGSIAEAVVPASHKYIREGNAARIPELIELLKLYGNKSLAEDYLNCGQSDLNAAGKAWAHKHGYYVGSGYGSHRVRWGSR